MSNKLIKTFSSEPCCRCLTESLTDIKKDEGTTSEKSKGLFSGLFQKFNDTVTQNHLEFDIFFKLAKTLLDYTYDY